MGKKRTTSLNCGFKLFPRDPLLQMDIIDFLARDRGNSRAIIFPLTDVEIKSIYSPVVSHL
jgi:hypothetical protein